MCQIMYLRGYETSNANNYIVLLLFSLFFILYAFIVAAWFLISHIKQVQS